MSNRYINRILNRDYSQKKDVEEIKNKLFPLFKGIIKKSFKKKQATIEEQKQKKFDWWTKQIGSADKARDRLTSKFLKLFDIQAEKVIARLRALEIGKGIMVKATARDAFDAAEWAEKIEIEIAPIFDDLIREAGIDALGFFGIDGDYVPSKRAADWLKKYPPKMARSVTNTQKKLLARELTAGIEAGEGIDTLSKRVRTVFSDLSVYKADQIAQTESVRAANFAAVDAWKESGAVEAKEWITENDGVVCPECEILDGKIIGLDDTYIEKNASFNGIANYTSYADVDEPPAHVGCRCICAPILINEKMLDEKVGQKKI